MLARLTDMIAGLVSLWALFAMTFLLALAFAARFQLPPITLVEEELCQATTRPEVDVVLLRRRR